MRWVHEKNHHGLSFSQNRSKQEDPLHPPMHPQRHPGGAGRGGQAGQQTAAAPGRNPGHLRAGGGTIMHLTGGRGGAANGVVRHGVMNKNGTNKRQTGTHIMEQYRKS